MLRPGSRVLFSAVVMWEVTVKRALGRLSVPSDWSQPLLDGGACLCRHPALPGHGARGGHDAGGRAGVGAGRRDGGRAAPRPCARRVARRRLSRPHARGARHAASPGGLLDTCHEERHPVGARALEHTIVQAALQRRDERMAPLVDLVSAFGEMDEPRKKVVGTIRAGIHYDLGDADIGGWNDRVQLVAARYDGAWNSRTGTWRGCARAPPTGSRMRWRCGSARRSGPLLQREGVSATRFRGSVAHVT